MRNTFLSLLCIILILGCSKNNNNPDATPDNPTSLNGDLLFQRSYTGTSYESYEIYSLNLKTKAETPLTNFSSNGSLDINTTDASWNQDKTKIIFISDKDNSQYPEIYSCLVNGNSLTRLTHNSLYDYNPVVSPDGSKIAFSRILSTGNYISNDGSDLFIMNSDGSNEIQLTNYSDDGKNYNRVDAICWANNNEIYFTSFKDNYSTIKEDIYKINITNSKVNRITNNLNLYPVDLHLSNYVYSTDLQLSKDGNFFTFFKPINGTFQVAEIFKIKTDGTGLTQLTSFSNNGAIDKSSYQSSWTLDNKILFISQKDSPLGEIYLMNNDGSNLTRITNNNKVEELPQIK